MDPIAIIYQSKPAPERGGVQKPMKPGGYSDSRADIAFCLRSHGLPLITPVEKPQSKNDYDWVFPDTKEGIEGAIKKGAQTFWLNTVLHDQHPITLFSKNDISIIGQIPEAVDRYDDKFFTNHLLQEHGLPIPKITLIEKDDIEKVLKENIPFPQVVKPIRGRGSQGVSVVHNMDALKSTLQGLFLENRFGDQVYMETYLPGEEITLTIMPPGVYEIHGKMIQHSDYWSLPTVVRFNHMNGITPYSGKVAVVENSRVLDDAELHQEKIELIKRQCEKAAGIIQAKAPIRIDCRANDNGVFYMFDLNMKPNMTGASRAHRMNQDSLTMIAARKIGWTYFNLLNNLVNQKWPLSHES